MSSLSTSFNGPNTDPYLCVPPSTFLFTFFFTQALYGEAFLKLAEEIYLGTQWESDGSTLCYCIYNWDTVVTPGYCPSTAFITVVTEATLLKYGLFLDAILFDGKMRTQISAFWGRADVELLQKYSNTKRQNNQVNTILFPIVNLPCYLLSCHTTVRSNNIGVTFYSELSLRVCLADFFSSEIFNHSLSKTQRSISLLF